MSSSTSASAPASQTTSSARLPEATLAISGLTIEEKEHEQATTAATSADTEAEAEAGPSTTTRSTTAADKWVKPNGPPVGSTFGARYLGEDEDVFQHNAWDHVTLPEDFAQRAQEIMELHRSSPVAEGLREGYNTQPANYWNKFYAQHQEGFFKDRQWLRLELPELIACSEGDAGPKTVLEVGCGAGNTVFPLLMRNENPHLVIHATDYSSTAVEVVKANKMYPTPEHGKGILHASVWDITSKPGPSSAPKSAPTLSESLEQSTAAGSLNQKSTTTSPPEAEAVTATAAGSETYEQDHDTPTYSLPDGIEPGTVDIISVIFVLSALHPKEWEQAIHNLYTALRPGGLLFIRDYGRHDLAQLRIKKNRLLDPATPNLYIRGDGTRVYFFEKEELEGMLLAPPRSRPVGGSSHSAIANEEKGMFEIDQLGEDRRLIVNRKLKLQMYRIWLQVKARKL